MLQDFESRAWRALAIASAIVVLFSASCRGAAPAGRPPDAEPDSEWAALVAAARREGRVSIIGSGSADVRDALTLAFERTYGIRAEFHGMRTAEIATRVGIEREAGRYLWDVYVSGATQALNTLIPMGAFDPLEPALVLPDVKSPPTWRGGALPFRDTERRLFVMAAVQRGTVYVNPNNVGPDELRSYWDLLDPQWHGRIVADDPRVAGPGQATFGFFYLHPDLGPDFIRRLAEQQLLLLRDYRQEIDQVAQGRRSILIGTSDVQVEALMKAGLPIAIIDPQLIKEGTGVTAGNGNLALFNRAPHPNAAKLYINWLLSKEGQTGFVRSEGYVSQRLDVPTDHAAPWRVPVPDTIDIDAPESVQLRSTTLLPLLEDLFGK